MMYSSSVPVSVPTWNRQQHTDFLDESEDVSLEFVLIYHILLYISENGYL
jgi:hypothetical protein